MTLIFNSLWQESLDPKGCTLRMCWLTGWLTMSTQGALLLVLLTVDLWLTMSSQGALLLLKTVKCFPDNDRVIRISRRSQLFIRQFFSAKHPEIAAKFDEKEKEDGLVRPDQVFKSQKSSDNTSFQVFCLNADQTRPGFQVSKVIRQHQFSSFLPQC